MVDHDVGLADLGEGIAAAAELDAQRRLGLADPGGVDRVLGGDREGLAKRRGVGAGGLVEPGQPNLGEPVERPRLDVERRPKSRRPAPTSTAVVTSAS